MKKLIKPISIIVVSIIATTSLFTAIHTIYVQSHKNEVVEYLIDKYGFKKQDIVLINYRPSQFHDDTDLGVPFDWYNSSDTWKVKYNGRTFGVSRSEFGLADDYQLEDIFAWSVDYLKSVDSNIVGIKIDCGKLHNVVKKEEIENFLTSVNESFIVYYKVDELDNYYSVSKNGLKFTKDNFKKLNSEFINKYHFINKDIENKGVVLTTSNIEFSRNEYDNFASYYYDTKVPQDVLSKKGMTLQ